MRKKVATVALTAVMAVSMGVSAFAAGWQNSGTGWWWQNDDGSYPSAVWQWIDGNFDGVAECYYFNESGYCLLNTITPDGFNVNDDGAWIIDGVIQTKAMEAQTAPGSHEQNLTEIYGNYINPYGEQITLTDEGGDMVLSYYEDKGGETEVLITKMQKVDDTTYQSVVYDAVNIKFLDSATFIFYDGIIYTKQ